MSNQTASSQTAHSQRSIQFKSFPVKQFLGIAVLLASLGLNGCSLLSRMGKPPEQLPAQPSDALVFEDVTLEQADPQGGLLWKLDATQATYSRSGQQAEVTLPQGDFFREGQAIYNVSARKGIVNQDGAIVILQESVVAQDLRTGARVTAEEAEWRPNEDVLILRRNVVATQDDLTVRAVEGVWSGSINHLGLRGEPHVIVTLEKQRLRLETLRLTWQIKEQLVSGDRPLQIQQFDVQNPQQVSRQANGQTSLVNLKAQDILLTGAAQLVATAPPLTINSEALRWNLANNELTSEVPVTVLQRAEQLLVTANQGRANLTQERVYLEGNVQGNSTSKQAQLKADSVDWNTRTQQMQALGNVTYIQVDPPLQVSGPRADGNLSDGESVVVSGGRVTTVITP